VQEQRPKSGEGFERGGVYSVRDFVSSKFHSTAANDPVPDAPPKPLPKPSRSSRDPARRRIGQFELIEVLGHGSMGSVYRARDTDAGREVALKVTKLQDNPARVERFRREGTITASLDHPGIVGVHSAGLERGVPWIAYELVEGHSTLSEAFAVAGTGIEARVQLVVEAGQALGYAHSRGVVHRDVKPANILVDRAGRVRVADFGLALAHSADRLTATGAFLGTPLFMSPEQFSGKVKATSASDVWSLGVILYLALTGEVPFDGENLVELGHAILQADPARPSTRSREVSAELEAVCLRALREKPDDRYSDGSLFAADLELALDGRSEAGADFRRRRTHGLIGGALILGIGAFAVGLLSRGSDSRPEALLPDVPKRGSGSDPETAAPAPLSLATAESALARKDLKGVVEALKSARLSQVASAELRELRRRVLLEGKDRLGVQDSRRRLEPVYQVAATVAQHVQEPPDPAFANAVLARALQREHAAGESLGDPRVFDLVDQLSRSVLRPERHAVYRLLDWVAIPSTRPTAAEFHRTLHRLFLSVIGMEIDILFAHAFSLYGQPLVDKARGLRGRYLRILVLLSATPVQERPEIMVGRIRAYGNLGRFLEEATPELFGSRNRALALCHLARRRVQVHGPAAPVVQLDEALSLLPNDPTVHRSVALVRFDVGVEALRRGERAKGIKQLELAVSHGVAATTLMDPSHDRVLSLGAERLRCNETLVGLYALLGRRAEAEAVIRSLPSWVRPSTIVGLESQYAEYTELRRRLIDRAADDGSKGQ
jgi:serine/threonine protein kinase